MENKSNVAGSGPAWLKQDDKTENKDKGKSPVVTIIGFRDLNAEFEECTNNSSNGVNAASSSVSTAGHNSINSTNDFSAAGPSNAVMPNLENITHSDDADDVGAEADINNLESIISVSPIPTTRIHKDHPTSQIIGYLSSTTQTRSMARAVRDQVDLPYRKRAIGTKWVYRNKKDERGIVIRNKARLVTQGHTQEEGIDYEEVKQKKDGIYISQDKYVAEILKKFRLSERKSASTPIDAEKPLLKDSDGEDVDVQTYRNVVIKIAVNILSDTLPITTNGIQLTMSNPQERVDSP
nr:hypothetical protein [Tanacetum cinerariifolium]